MARSPSHKFGQIVGELLELAIEPIFRTFARRNKLFLDVKGNRPGRTQNAVSWKDLYGNIHELDFVFERGGTQRTIGQPVAFIESAWRRYTKHSRNKAQEIQGAILPLAATHQQFAPFIGVILAGEFTDGALTQLRSHGFHVLFFPYRTVIAAFKPIGIDASFDQDTPDKTFRGKVKQWESLSAGKKAKVAGRLIALNQTEVNHFMSELSISIKRYVISIRILPLHGKETQVGTISQAISFIRGYKEVDNTFTGIVRYEIAIIYSNDDKINAHFQDKSNAIIFLQTYQAPTMDRPRDI